VLPRIIRLAGIPVGRRVGCVRRQEHTGRFPASPPRRPVRRPHDDARGKDSCCSSSDDARSTRSYRAYDPPRLHHQSTRNFRARATSNSYAARIGASSTQARCPIARMTYCWAIRISHGVPSTLPTPRAPSLAGQELEIFGMRLPSLRPRPKPLPRVQCLAKTVMNLVPLTRLNFRTDIRE
jgi:hypothetical protein